MERRIRVFGIYLATGRGCWFWGGQSWAERFGGLKWARLSGLDVLLGDSWA